MSTYFDEAAPTWDTPEKVDRSRTIARAIAASVPLQPDWDALEYGCGTGQVTWNLADELRHVTLADTSEGMLDAVRARLAAEPSPRFSVARLDLSIDPAPPVTYDLVYTVMALHHIADVDRVLAEFHATLKPGGWLAIADLDADLEGHFHGEGHDGHHGFDRDDLAARVEAAGFSQPAVRTATTITKGPEGGPQRTFDVFLAVARRV